jgi:hypothetical protein
VSLHLVYEICLTFGREKREHKVFQVLLQMIPGIEERLTESSNEELIHIGELVGDPILMLSLRHANCTQIQKGASGARSDDTKSLKGAVLDWITPRSQSLRPTLARNVKTDRGFHHERTGALLCPAGLDWSNAESVSPLYIAIHFLICPRTKDKLRSGEMVVSGDQWPIFLYHGYSYDPEDPWNGLFRSSLLVSVSATGIQRQIQRCSSLHQGYKHIFTSPSSVEKEPKATRSGNARIHGMTRVTAASIAYIATQVRC